MNGEQQRKALNYALFFLRSEIKELKDTLRAGVDPLVKPHLDQRLKDLEVDFEMFLRLENTFI